MFLVTTADRSTWDATRPILFLGHWCLRYDQRADWSGLDHEVLPYPWADRALLAADYRFLRALGETALETLVPALNAAHGTALSKRYWSIVLGRWLFYFLHIAFERYRLVRAAADTGRVADTWIVDDPPEAWLPGSFAAFRDWSVTDSYNHHLIGRIIRILGCLPYTSLPARNRAGREPDAGATDAGGSASTRGKKSMRRAIGACIGLYGRLAPNRFQRVGLWGSGMEVREQLALHRAMGQFCLYQAPPLRLAHRPRIDWPARRRLSLDLGEGEFEQLAGALLPAQLPTAFLENHAAMSRRARATLPRAARVVFVGGTPREDSGWHWVAHHVERGARLVMGQHGGHFGAAALNGIEDYEKSIADRYFSWGWRWAGDDNVVPLPSPKLTRQKRRLKPDPGGSVLWVLTSNPRYSHWIGSMPMGPLFLDYWDEQERFARAASPALRALLRLRHYPKADFGWDETSRQADSMPEISRSNGERSLDEELHSARLFIGTYNATTPLEALAANLPTILFWRPEHWEIKPEAQPYYDDLRRAGILHDTAESAAGKANEVCEAPRSWWFTPEVQAARNRFCATFARTDQRWIRDWRDALGQLA